MDRKTQDRATVVRGRLYLDECGAENAELSHLALGPPSRPIRLTNCRLINCDLSLLDPLSEIRSCYIEGGQLPQWMMPGGAKWVGMNVKEETIHDTIRGNIMIGRLGPTGELLIA